MDVNIETTEDYRREVVRLAGAPDWTAAVCASPLGRGDYDVPVRHSDRCGMWSDYLYADDGEESIDARAWNEYGPAVAFYALWWDTYLIRLALRR